MFIFYLHDPSGLMVVMVLQWDPAHAVLYVLLLRPVEHVPEVLVLEDNHLDPLGGGVILHVWCLARRVTHTTVTLLTRQLSSDKWAELWPRLWWLITHVTLYQTGSRVEFKYLVSNCPQVLFVDIKTQECRLMSQKKIINVNLQCINKFGDYFKASVY